MVKLHIKLLIWINFIFVCRAARKVVDITPTSGLDLDDNYIIKIFTHNKSNTRDFENLTIAFKDTEEIFDINSEADSHLSGNNGEIQEIKNLLEIVPEFDLSAENVSAQCRKDSELFKRALRKMSLWAVKMYDATAKIPSGLLSGNVNQLGDFDECLGVDSSADQSTGEINGQYCLVYLQIDVDKSRPYLKYLHRLTHSHYAFRSNLTDPGHRVPRFSTVNWAVCTPASCSPRDVEITFKDKFSKYTRGLGLDATIRVDREMCQVQRTDSLPVATVIVCLLFAGIIILSIVGAICDHYYVNVNEILLSFSLKRNFRKLISLKRSQDDIATVHGVRAINALMLIVAHKSMAVFFYPYANRTTMAEYLGRPWTVLGRAASLYTDPFIMLSGLLTTYSFVQQLDRSGKIDVKREYLSRLLRLVPTLGALILFCTFIMPYIGSGPQWNLVVTHHAEICKITWWRNLLFIHNYFGFENMCLTHTHHVGIDTQLFALSPLMIFTLYKWPKFGGLALAIIALLSTTLRFYVTYYKRLSNYVFFGTSIRQLFDTANLSYILPSHRLTVYIIGIYLGYLLRRYPKGLKINKSIIRLGWMVTSLAALAAFLGPAGMGSINYVYDPIHAAAYNAFAPIGWCAFFAWIVVVSHTDNSTTSLTRFFGWRGFLVSTRLSYAVYLTQFPVFFYNVGVTRTSETYDFVRMHFNFNEFFWIILTAAILTLLFDTPFQNIKNYLLKPKSKNQITQKINDKKVE
ncbi:nose resistant to fluoxetine protein 6 isoform X1 [Microplitis mediator]|uniref:nose resistant to fluoxetine protein 6 isoform X1 n=2 Tax=Microplitis mediator TaxID=375433 RepID=UPI002554B909|nr:nose resistant to fluoxetine protein 6 isoform X1 [Microplitis mediator]